MTAGQLQRSFDNDQSLEATLAPTAHVSSCLRLAIGAVAIYSPALFSDHADGAL